jgi:GIY-YIG catalytic domain
MQINAAERRIQFTVEKEKERVLPFLNLKVIREKDRLVTDVYRKPTHTQRYVHWRSNHPRNNQVGILKNLLLIASRICDRKEDFSNEVNLLRDVFISNGYPWQVVDRAIKDSLEKKTRRSLGIIAEGKKESEFYDIVHAPYVEGFSELIQKKLRKMNVGFVMKRGETIGKVLCNGKFKMHHDDMKNVVYAIKCNTCKVHYIGETGQKFCERLKQHKNDARTMKQTNGISCHLMKQPDHVIDWDKAIFIDHEKDWISRKIGESLYIEAMNPGKEIKTVMNIEKGKRIHEGWDRFLPDIKQELCKRFKGQFESHVRMENDDEFEFH